MSELLNMFSLVNRYNARLVEFFDKGLNGNFRPVKKFKTMAHGRKRLEDLEKVLESARPPELMAASGVNIEARPSRRR